MLFHICSPTLQLAQSSKTCRCCQGTKPAEVFDLQSQDCLQLVPSCKLGCGQQGNCRCGNDKATRTMNMMIIVDL
eukprot:3429044-Amphidinium_carterae.1